MGRPCIEHIASLSSLDSGCKITLLIRKLLSEMFRDLCTGCYPHSRLAINVLNNFLESLETSRLADAATVQSNSHHLWGSLRAFVVKGVEGAFDVVVEVSRRAEPGRYVEFVVIAIYVL